jgi:hypothetical protein
MTNPSQRCPTVFYKRRDSPPTPNRRVPLAPPVLIYESPITKQFHSGKYQLAINVLRPQHFQLIANHADRRTLISPVVVASTVPTKSSKTANAAKKK